MSTPSLLSTLSILVLGAGTARAQTIYVDTSDDVVDFGGSQRVADLPGPDGKISLAEAGLASDNTPGVQTIGFHVPQSDWQYQNFFPGRVVLKPFLGFRLFDTAIVDGRTQTAFTGETNPDGGGEVVIWTESYLIDSTGGGVYGLDNSVFHVSGGSGNVLQGNSVTSFEVFDSTGNLVGGPNPGDGNTCGYVQIDRASDNVVQGNVIQRLRVLGWVGGGQPATDNRIGGPTVGERNVITGNGYKNSEGIPSGYAVQLFDTVGTVMENNWIGVQPDGLTQGHEYSTIGIWFDGENYDTAIRDNMIAGILALATPHSGNSYYMGHGILFTGRTDGARVTGNTIGLNAVGDPVLGSVLGIEVWDGYPSPHLGLVLGGGQGDGNEIAGHMSVGVRVRPTSQEVRIAGNSIHENGGIGIDLITSLYEYGVTQNDPLDTDTGANGLQNFPELTSAVRTASSIQVLGALHSSPNDDFRVEFFASPTCDASGHGQGTVFLGATLVTTDGSGNAAVDAVLPALAPSGWSVTATATLEPVGATSEFSTCVPLTDGGTLGTNYCGPAEPNSTGLPATITATGSDQVVDQNFHLLAQSMPPNKFGYFLTSDTQGFVSHPGGSQGNLCLGGQIGRFVLQIQNSGTTGSFTIQVDLTHLPAPLNVPVQSGDTWNFTTWYRDKNPGTTSNFTDAVSVLFQ